MSRGRRMQLTAMDHETFTDMSSPRTLLHHPCTLHCAHACSGGGVCVCGRTRS